jgi:hypothetical protein
MPGNPFEFPVCQAAKDAIMRICAAEEQHIMIAYQRSGLRQSFLA